MPDIAETIARRWYEELELIYEKVDFGKVIEYDALQIINRLLLENAKTNSTDNSQPHP